MIVDDDRTMVSLLKILLEMDGYEVVNVTHGRDFLPNVREEVPDIVLLDVFLTNMDGKELVAEVRSQVRILSSIEGLRQMVSFPFSVVRNMSARFKANGNSESHKGKDLVNEEG